MTTEYKSVTELAADHPNLLEYIGQMERQIASLEEEVRWLKRRVFETSTGTSNTNKGPVENDLARACDRRDERQKEGRCIEPPPMP